MVRIFDLRFLLAVFTAMACFTFGTQALAQTIDLTEGSIKRSNSFRTSSQNPLWISKADCLSNDAFFFPLTVSGQASGDQLEVWVGGQNADCTDDEDRSGANQLCWQVYEGVPTSTGLTVEVPVRNIVAEDLEDNGDTNYGEEICETTQTTTAPRAIDLYFMFINDRVFKGGYKWQTQVDLAGPNPPQDVSVGEGDSILVIEWSDTGDTDQVGYNFYCDPPPGEETVDPGGVPLSGPDMPMDGGATTYAADVQVPVLDASDDAMGDAEGGTDASTGDAAPDTSTGTTGPSGSCETYVLYEGAEPPEDPKYLCGSASGTSGRVKGLVNGVTYAVAVAGTDSVGNVGKLSNVDCNSPTIVNDFYRVYRDAGGQAGGGFCTASGGVGHGAGVSGLILIALAAVGGSLRRRRLS